MTRGELHSYIRRHGCTNAELASLFHISIETVGGRLREGSRARAFTEDEISQIMDMIKDRPEIPYEKGKPMRTRIYKLNNSFKMVRKETENHWLYKLVISKGYTLHTAAIRLGYKEGRLTNAISDERRGKPIPEKLIEAVKNKL